jgi:hypothetical protein
MNLRVVATGAAMIVLAIAFFFGMAAAAAPKSNDPQSLMQTVGTVSGGVGALGIVMIGVGVLRKKR